MKPETEPETEVIVASGMGWDRLRFMPVDVLEDESEDFIVGEGAW